MSYSDQNKSYNTRNIKHFFFHYMQIQKGCYYYPCLPIGISPSNIGKFTLKFVNTILLQGTYFNYIIRVPEKERIPNFI